MGKKKGYLILGNGEIFAGTSFGAQSGISGEVVFNTGMMGYPESLTDPSYYGQILTMTYPLIGNYGVPPQTMENGLLDNYESEKIQIRGLIVSSYIDNNTHWQSKSTLSSWLKREGIPALSGIDTRTLTKIIREFGTMGGIITFEGPRTKIGANFFYDINKENLLPFVSCKTPIKYGNGILKILLIDCGVKLNQIRMLLKYDTQILRVPWDYNPFAKNDFFHFDVIVISNGPGDARLAGETVQVIREAITRKIPILGICLGNQILALAAGGDIFKLKYGHRGQNQPVKDELTNKCYITSQNHGFAVKTETLPKGWVPWFTNLNDRTNEGVRHSRLPFFSVQFHPEATPGPTDTEWLFDYFIKETNRWLKKN
jgi:carbamoyl-phosphate synthase small subunit